MSRDGGVASVINDFKQRCALAGRSWVSGRVLHLDIEALSMPWYLLLEQPGLVASIAVDDRAHILIEFTAQLVDHADELLLRVPTLVEQLNSDYYSQNFQLLAKALTQNLSDLKEASANDLDRHYMLFIRFLIANLDNLEEVAKQDPEQALNYLNIVEQLQRLQYSELSLQLRIIEVVMQAIRFVINRNHRQTLLDTLIIRLGLIANGLVESTEANSLIGMRARRAEIECLFAIQNFCLRQENERGLELARDTLARAVRSMEVFDQYYRDYSGQDGAVPHYLFSAQIVHLRVISAQILQVSGSLTEPVLEYFGELVKVTISLLTIPADEVYPNLGLDLSLLLMNVYNFLTVSEQLHPEVLQECLSCLYAQLRRVLVHFIDSPQFDSVVPFVRGMLANMFVESYEEDSEDDVLGLVRLLAKILETDEGKEFVIQIPMSPKSTYYKDTNWLHVLMCAKRQEVIREGLALLCELDLFNEYFEATCTIDNSDEPINMVTYLKELSERCDQELFCNTLRVLIEQLLPLRRYWDFIAKLIKEIEFPVFQQYVVGELYRYACENKIYFLLEAIVNHGGVSEKQLAELCVCALQDSEPNKARFFFRKLNNMLSSHSGKQPVPDSLRVYLRDNYQEPWQFPLYIDLETGKIFSTKQIPQFAVVKQLQKHGFEVKHQGETHQLVIYKNGKQYKCVDLGKELHQFRQLDVALLELQVKADVQSYYDSLLVQYYNFQEVRTMLLKLVEFLSRCDVHRDELKTRFSKLFTILFEKLHELYEALEYGRKLPEPLASYECYINWMKEFNTRLKTSSITGATEAISVLERLQLHVDTFDNTHSSVTDFLNKLNKMRDSIKTFSSHYLGQVEYALGLSKVEPASCNVTLDDLSWSMLATLDHYHQLCAQNVIVVQQSFLRCEGQGQIPEFILDGSQIAPLPQDILFSDQEINGMSLFASGVRARGARVEASVINETWQWLLY